MTAIVKIRQAPAAEAKAARVGRSFGDGLANAIICIAVMLACVVAVILLAAR